MDPIKPGAGSEADWFPMDCRRHYLRYSTSLLNHIAGQLLVLKYRQEGDYCPRRAEFHRSSGNAIAA